MRKLLFVILYISLTGCKTSKFKFVTTNVEKKKSGVVEIFEINGKSDSYGQSGYVIRKFKCRNKEKTKVTFLFYEAHNSDDPLPIAYVSSKKMLERNTMSHLQTIEIRPQKAQFKIDFLGAAPVLTNRFKIIKGDSIVIQSYLVYVQYFVD